MYSARALSVRSEIKQQRPFPSPHQEAVVTLMRTADLARRVVAGVVEAHGITAQQYNVLRILRGAGSDGLPTLEIAQRMIERTPGITRLLDRLERKKLVTRQRSSTDRRCVYCRISEEGLRVLGRLDGPVQVAAAQCFDSFTKRDLAQLVESLDRTRERMNLQFERRRSE